MLFVTVMVKKKETFETDKILHDHNDLLSDFIVKNRTTNVCRVIKTFGTLLLISKV